MSLKIIYKKKEKSRSDQMILLDVSDHTGEKAEDSLLLAWNKRCKKIAFAFPSTDKEDVQKVVSVIADFIAEHEMKVDLVLPEEFLGRNFHNLFQKMDAYIEENFFDPEVLEMCQPKCLYAAPKELVFEKHKKRKLEDVVKQAGETFQEKLLRMIDEKGFTDVEVYKKANMSRKLFSKIRCNKDYKPKKKTALSLAIALELNLDEAKDLLARAGYAFSPSDKTDLIIQFFIEEEVYDIYTIDLALFEHGEPALSD